MADHRAAPGSGRGVRGYKPKRYADSKPKLPKGVQGTALGSRGDASPHYTGKGTSTDKGFLARLFGKS